MLFSRLFKKSLFVITLLFNNCQCTFISNLLEYDINMNNDNSLNSRAVAACNTYIASGSVTSANQLPIPALNSISGSASTIVGDFIQVNFPTLDATVLGYNQTISIVTNTLGAISTVSGCSNIQLVGGCGLANVQIPSVCVPKGVYSGANIVYTIMFQFSSSVGVYTNQYDFSTTATIASTSKTTTQLTVVNPVVIPATYTFLTGKWNDLNQTYSVTLGVTQNQALQFEFVGLTYTYTYLNAQGTIISIQTASSIVYAVKNSISGVLTVSFTVGSLTSGCALQSFTVNGVYVAINPQTGNPQDFIVNLDGSISLNGNPHLYSETVSTTAINTNAASTCNNANAGQFTFPAATASISSCKVYKPDHTTIDAAAVFNDYIDCTGTITNLNSVTFNILLTGINGYSWANAAETNANNLACGISSASCTSFKLASPCANAATTQSALCYYNIAQGVATAQLTLAFTLTLTSVNGVSAQRRDNIVSRSLSTSEANALVGSVMQTSLSLTVNNNDQKTSDAFDKYIMTGDMNALLALLFAATIAI
jgi:hypothetical protein